MNQISSGPAGSRRCSVLHPGDPRWDASAATFNLAVDQRPARIALPRDAADVADAVREASRGGLRVVAQSTGHGAAALPDLADVLLIRTDHLDAVSVDSERRRALVGAGASWDAVVDAAARERLVGLHGSSGHVAVTGYSLNGGIGWYGRRFGLQASSITGAAVVLPGGEQRWVDAEHEPDLLWALRGGGAGFGIVTELEFALHEAGDIVAGALFFPIERAHDVLHAWQAWALAVPEEVTSLGRILRVPDLPAAPERLRGRAFALIEAVITGAACADADALLAPLRRLSPARDTFAAVAPNVVPTLHMDPHNPVAYQRADALLSGLTGAAVDRVLELAGPGVRTPLLSVELRHLGGAMGRAPEHPGALARLDGEALLVALGMHQDAAGAAAVRDAARTLTDALAPQAATTRAANFVEEVAAPETFFDGPTAARLGAIRQAVDPDGTFIGSHGAPDLEKAA